ncbi:MAG: PilZ domain-containing protein [Rhodocyclaceae bacterium]|nr:PilZ domain-containing protein [Rhodocyclaceae bacterium]
MSEPTKNAAAARPSVMSLSITSKSALYASYMPFLKQGGIFLPTTRIYHLGDEVFLLLQLMEDPTRLPVAGTVVWVTPAGAQGGKQQGIGVQFKNDESGQAVRTRIETIIGPYLNSPRPTHTV